MLGKEITVRGVHLPANPSEYLFSIHSYDLLERLLKEKKIQHQKVKVMGGLEKVPEGFAYMKEGKNSAEKIVYHPAVMNTPALSTRIRPFPARRRIYPSN